MKELPRRRFTQANIIYNAISTPERIKCLFACLVLLMTLLSMPFSAKAVESPLSYNDAVNLCRSFNFASLQLAIDDLTQSFPKEYAQGSHWLSQLKTLQNIHADVLQDTRTGAQARTIAHAEAIQQLRQDALLANPLLDFDQLLITRRAYWYPDGKDSQWAKNAALRGQNLGFPRNDNCIASVPKDRWDNELAVLSPVTPSGTLTTLFRPDEDVLIEHPELNFDGDRIMFTMPKDGRYQVFEIQSDGAGLRQVSRDMFDDVENFDATWLPDGRIIFSSTANYQSVPCYNGLSIVGSLYLMDADGSNIRQLTFDQDDDNTPVILNDGRVMFLRWEYTNTPHFYTRLLFQMSPDGTNQRELYGSNSYWPNAIYFARPIPDHPTKIVGVVSGHHGVNRMGELVIFDPAKGNKETAGVVQRIPGYGKTVQPKFKDRLVDDSWPKFIAPWPLNENYFIVSCKPSPKAEWGIYLVDTFDNMLLLHEEPGYAMLHPTPMKKTVTPPVIPDRVDLTQEEGVVYMQDVYEGPGLAGVPKGTVKSLRVHEYHFGYRGLTGWTKIGIDGPWDVMRIIGTVPVEADGSAMFRVPANKSLAVQPLDADGRALQIMRSWFTVMPGEVRSCVGCHESPRTTPTPLSTVASQKGPVTIDPWYGPARGFDFEREVQPVLDSYCVSCHDGSPAQAGAVKPDLRRNVPGYTGTLVNVPSWWPQKKPVTDAEQLSMMIGGDRKHTKILFTPAYEALHPYTRRPGLEGDYHLPYAGEFFTNTSKLIQMLDKGHYNVQLDRESRDKLTTWIDLNVPCHGTWSDVAPIPFNGRERRKELLQHYTGMTYDPEEVPDMPNRLMTPVIPAPMQPVDRRVSAPNWPLTPAAAKKLQQTGDGPTNRTVSLGDQTAITLTRIPAGQFVMGDADGAPDEYPLSLVKIQQPFWMGAFEITNAQYALFDPDHDSRYVNHLQTSVIERGYPVNEPQQPVVRISWERAMEFCEWLSARTGEKFTLPTEAQWEWACRAGGASPLNYGDTNDDFSRMSNLADSTLTMMSTRKTEPLHYIQPDWVLKDSNVNDRSLVTSAVGQYQPNVWGLYDMHGNASEWTRTAYRSYPYRDGDGRNTVKPDEERVVRGGSWYDRPARARSGHRLKYPTWQRVFDVGFRVVSTGAHPDNRRSEQGE
jgi:formylglycine-generating enzyme required for sulfatase activity